MKLAVVQAFAFCFFLLAIDASHAGCLARIGRYPDCSQGHCSRVNEDQGLNEWCIASGFAGCPTLFSEVSRSCYCVCSCVAGDTLIQLADGGTKMARDLIEGDEIASPLSGNSASKVLHITATDATGFAALKLFFEDGSDIVVSENHVFLGIDGKYHSADALNEGDELASLQNTPVVVSSIEMIRNYEGLLYNVIINERSKARADHLLVTNGVMSGDFILQNDIDREIAANKTQNR